MGYHLWKRNVRNYFNKSKVKDKNGIILIQSQTNKKKILKINCNQSEMINKNYKRHCKN
jgi:hypothetical protein